jgi:hypothetical protein
MNICLELDALSIAAALKNQDDPSKPANRKRKFRAMDMGKSKSVNKSKLNASVLISAVVTPGSMYYHRFSMMCTSLGCQEWYPASVVHSFNVENLYNPVVKPNNRYLAGHEIDDVIYANTLPYSYILEQGISHDVHKQELEFATRIINEPVRNYGGDDKSSQLPQMNVTLDDIVKQTLARINENTNNC